MPRKPRELYPDALYHVTSRGNAREAIFHTDEDRQRFLEQLGERVEAYGVVVYAFVLMDNHYHLLVRTPRANLDRFMQRLNTSYALYYRYKHAKPGHVFQGRYKAVVVQDDSYVLTLTRYIHLNPVKTRNWQKAGRKQRVEHLRAYRWSSYPSYIRGAPQYPWLKLDVLQHYGRSRRLAARRYRAYAEDMIVQDDAVLVEALKRAGQRLGGDPTRDETGKAKARQDVSLARLDRAVAAYFGLRGGELTRHGHVAGEAKRVAMEAARRVTGLGLKAIGAHYGGLSASAVNMNRRRLRGRDVGHIEAITKRLNS